MLTISIKAYCVNVVVNIKPIYLNKYMLCVESVRIRSYSGPYFPAFGQDTDRYSPSLHIQSKCRKMRTRITPNTDTFYAVLFFRISVYKNE